MTAVENDDGTDSSVTFEYISLTEDEANSTGIALCTGCVRAVSLGSKWQFTALDDEGGGGAKTRVELEVAADPNSPSLSPFIVNMLKKRWAYASMRGLVTASKLHLGREREVRVTNILSRMFPLK